MKTLAFMVSIIIKKKKSQFAQLQTHIIPADRRNCSVFKQGSEKSATLITMKACLTRNFLSFPGSCSICLEWEGALCGAQYGHLANNRKC